MFHHPIAVQVLGGPLDGARVVLPADLLDEGTLVCLEGPVYKFIWFMGQPTFVYKETE